MEIQYIDVLSINVKDSDSINPQNIYEIITKNRSTVIKSLSSGFGDNADTEIFVRGNKENLRAIFKEVRQKYYSNDHTTKSPK
jgi:hypothetical protein